MERLTFEVARSALEQTRWVRATPEPLQDGEISLRVDRFAFTANNITYAEMGEMMAYWRFFPASEADWGVIPVWGFADILASRVEGLAVGERIYGYWPMASECRLQPARLEAGQFVDAQPHRRQLPAAYQRYARCAADPLWRPDWEDWQALLHPLFVTAFLIDDMIADQEGFGAQQVLLSSASSKTALILAHCLQRRGGMTVIGLTSGAHRQAVTDLGCYDRVCAYEDLTTLDGAVPTVYVDFAGNGALRLAVHTHWNEQLRHSCAVGLSHRQTQPPGAGLPGPRPQFFFAPDRLRQRAQDWGRAGLDARLAAAWREIVPAVASGMQVHHERGPDAVAAAYARTLRGEVPPSWGQMLSIAD